MESKDEDHAYTTLIGNSDEEDLGLSFICQGRQIGSILFRTPQNYCFLQVSTSPNKRQLRCRQYKKGCPVRASVDKYPRGAQIFENGEHDHPPETNFSEKYPESPKKSGENKREMKEMQTVPFFKMKGKTGHSTIYGIDEGFYYIQNTLSGNFRLLRCINYRSDCRATGKVSFLQGTTTMAIGGIHNHPPDPYRREVSQFEQDLIRRVETDSTPFKTIYEEEAKKYCPEVVESLPFKIASQRVYRRKRNEETYVRKPRRSKKIAVEKKQSRISTLQPESSKDSDDELETTENVPFFVMRGVQEGSQVYGTDEGYYYAKNSTTTTTMILRCVHYRKKKCRVWCKMPLHSDNPLMTIFGTHSHPPDLVRKSVIPFEDTLFRRVEEELSKSIREIYFEEYLRYPECAKYLPFGVAVQKMQRRRKAYINKYHPGVKFGTQVDHKKKKSCQSISNIPSEEGYFDVLEQQHMPNDYATEVEVTVVEEGENVVEEGESMLVYNENSAAEDDSQVIVVYAQDHNGESNTTEDMNFITRRPGNLLKEVMNEVEDPLKTDGMNEAGEDIVKQLTPEEIVVDEGNSTDPIQTTFATDYNETGKPSEHTEEEKQVTLKKSPENSGNFYRLEDKINQRACYTTEDGYFFELSAISPKSSILKCINCKQTSCKAVGKITPSEEGFSLVITGSHNHPPDMSKREVIEFGNVLLKRENEEKFVPLKKVYEEEATKNQNASVNLPYTTALQHFQINNTSNASRNRNSTSSETQLQITGDSDNVIEVEIEEHPVEMVEEDDIIIEQDYDDSLGGSDQDIDHFESDDVTIIDHKIEPSQENEFMYRIEKYSIFKKKDGNFLYGSSDGYFFNLISTRANTRSLKCNGFTTYKCKATGQIPLSNKTSSIIIYGKHNHPPEQVKMQLAEFERVLDKRVKEERLSFMTVFKAESERYHQAVLALAYSAAIQRFRRRPSELHTSPWSNKTSLVESSNLQEWQEGEYSLMPKGSEKGTNIKREENVVQKAGNYTIIEGKDGDGNMLYGTEEGYFFHLKKVLPKSKVLWCLKHTSLQCEAWATISNIKQNAPMVIYNNHNHPPYRKKSKTENLLESTNNKISLVEDGDCTGGAVGKRKAEIPHTQTDKRAKLNDSVMTVESEENFQKQKFVTYFISTGKSEGSQIYGTDEGYYFVESEKTSMSIILRCTTNVSQCKCWARIPVNGEDSDIMEVAGTHNHSPDPRRRQALEFEASLFRRAKEETTDYMQIYVEEAEKWPDVAKDLTYTKMLPRMQRRRLNKS